MAVPIVDTTWLNAHLDDPNLVILDASPISNLSGLKSTIDSIRIPGARFFDLKNNFSDAENTLPNMLPSAAYFEKAVQNIGVNKSSKIVVYDNLGIYASPRVWWMFKTMGHKEVFVLDGGLPAWIEAEYPTEPIAETDFPSGDFSAKLNSDAVFNLQKIKANINTETALVIDARSPGRFAGTSPEPRKGLPSGHIENSINIPFGNVLNDGKLKSDSELEKVFINVDSNKPLVFSCGSGLTACIVLIASEMVLKNEKSVYDGSWTEWAESEMK